jgi:hypothetical protein
MPVLKIRFDPVKEEVNYFKDSVKLNKRPISYRNDCLRALYEYSAEKYQVRGRSRDTSGDVYLPIPNFKETDEIYLSALSNFLIPNKLSYKLLENDSDWFIECNDLNIPWDLIVFPVTKCPRCGLEFHLPACNTCGRGIGPGLNFFYNNKTTGLDYPFCYCNNDLRKYFTDYAASPADCQCSFDLLTETRIEIPAGSFISLEKNIIPVYPGKSRRISEPGKYSGHWAHPSVLLVTAPFPRRGGYLYGIAGEIHELIMNPRTELGIDIDVYSNEEATVDNIKGILDKKQYDMFYFSGHYQWIPADPGQSALILTGGDEIKVNELETILGNKYPPKLVFVNSCNSCEQTRWENGLAGLPATFFKMGSCAFVGASGKIFDLVAMHIAKKMMHYFMEKNLDIATSLRLSKKDAFLNVREIDFYGHPLWDLRQPSAGRYLNWACFDMYAKQEGKYLWLTNYYQELRRDVLETSETYIIQNISPEIFDAAEYERNPGFYRKRKEIETEVLDFITGDSEESVRCFGIIGSTGVGKTNLLCRLLWDLKNEKDMVLFFINDMQLESANLDLISLTEDSFQAVGAFEKEELGLREILNRIKDDAVTPSFRLVYMIDRVDGTHNPNLVFENIHHLKTFWEKLISGLSLDITVNIIAAAREYAWSNFYAANAKSLQEDYKNIKSSFITNELVKNIAEFDPFDVKSLLSHRQEGESISWERLPYDLKQMILNPYIFHLLLSAPNKSDIIEEVSPRRRQMLLFEGYVNKKITQSMYIHGRHSEYRQYLDKIGDAMVDLARAQLTDSELNDSGIDGPVLDNLANSGITIRNYGTHQFVFDLLAEHLISNRLFLSHKDKELDPGTLAQWLEMMKRAASENTDSIIKGGFEKALGYWLLKKTETPLHCREISRYMLGEVYQDTPKAGTALPVATEALVLLGIRKPGLLGYILEYSFKESQRKIVLLRLAVEVLLSFRFGFEEESDRLEPLIHFVSKTLIDHDIFQPGENRQFFLKKVINLICGLSIARDGLFILEKIFEHFFEFEKKDGIRANIRELFKFLTREEHIDSVVPVFKQATSAASRRKRIRRIAFLMLRSNPLFTFKLIIKIFKMRKILGLKITGIKNIKQSFISGPLSDRLKIFTDISEQSLFLGFTFHKDNETRRRLVDFFDAFVSEKLLPEFKKVLEHYELSKLEDIMGMASFGIGLFLSDYFTKYFINSEHPIDPFEKVSGNENNYVYRLLPLLHPGGSIKEVEDFEEALTYCLFNPNAFENYLGKTVLIVQAANRLEEVIPIIETVFNKKVEINEVSGLPIPREVKVKRDILSILVFILRRIDTGKGLDELSKLHEVIDKITTDFCIRYEPFLLRKNLLGVGDLWHPISALGVSCGLLKRELIQMKDENKEENYIRYLVGRKKNASIDDKCELMKRLLFELWPVSYFYPGLCLRTLEDAIDYIANECDKGLFEKVKPDIVETLLVLDLVYFENLKLFFSKKREASAEQKIYQPLKMAFDEAQRSGDVQEKIVEYFFFSLKTQGSHEAITTIFSEFDFISCLIVGTLQTAVLNKDNFVGLLTAILNKILKEYKERGYRFWNLVEVEEPDGKKCDALERKAIE